MLFGCLRGFFHLVAFGYKCRRCLRSLTFNHAVVVVVGHRCSFTFYGVDESGKYYDMSLIVYEIDGVKDKPSGKSAFNERSPCYDIIAIVGVKPKLRCIC